MIWMFVVALVSPPLWAISCCLLVSLFKWFRFTSVFRMFANGWIGGSVGGLISAGIQHDWMWGAGSALSLAIAITIRWWWKHRDKVRAWLGAKSRALRDALVQRMPKPVVLRPVRGGA